MKRTTLPLLGSLLLLGACLDRELPTALAPRGASFVQSAATPVVNSLLDDDTDCTDTKCTLRAAIAFAGDGATIAFAASLTQSGPATITLTRGQFVIAKDLTIAGPGAHLLKVSGNDASRVFWIDFDRTVTLSGLTITRGYTEDDGDATNGDGGGIYNLAR